MNEILPNLRERAMAENELPESRVLVLYTGGTIGMRVRDGGELLFDLDIDIDRNGLILIGRFRTVQ